MTSLLRIIVLQCLWFFFIAHGMSSYSFLFPAIALITILIDKKYFIKNLLWSKFFIFTLVILLYGIISDSILLNLDLISFKNYTTWYTPLYFWAIWIIFIPYFDMAFYRFKGKPFVSIFMGAVFAPIAYLGGARIGSLNEISIEGLVGISISWMIFMPLSVKFYFKLTDGQSKKA